MEIELAQFVPRWRIDQPPISPAIIIRLDSEEANVLERFPDIVRHIGISAEMILRGAIALAALDPEEIDVLVGRFDDLPESAGMLLKETIGEEAFNRFVEKAKDEGWQG